MNLGELISEFPSHEEIEGEVLGKMGCPDGPLMTRGT